MELRRYSDALRDWERAIEVDDGARRDSLCLSRADCLVRMGRFPDAINAADEVAGNSGQAGTLYDISCVYALASANSASDAVAAKAVATLRRAFVAGYRSIPHMLKDDDLASLRRRDDYADLLWELADSPLAPPTPK